MTVQKVEFKSLGLTLVGDMYLPQGFDESKQYHRSYPTSAPNQRTNRCRAYTLGFEYPQYFSRLFKNKVGLTPSEYRTENRLH